MIIRSAKYEDVSACHKLLQIKEMAIATGGYYPYEELVDHIGHDHFYVAVDEYGCIVGTILGEKLRAKGSIIWFIVVQEDLRGQGIGTKLFTYYEDIVLSFGIEWIVLYGYYENDAVLRFYEKHGYSKGNTFVEYMKYIG